MADILAPDNSGMVGQMQMQIAQQALDRQRAIATMLQQQSMTPTEGQMVSGHYVKASPLQFLSKLAQGLIGKNQQSELDKQQLATAKGYDDGTQRLIGMLTGQGSQPATAAPATNPLSDVPQQSMPQAGGVVQMPTVTTQQGMASPFAGMNPGILGMVARQPNGMAELLKMGLTSQLKNTEATDTMKNANWMGRSPQELALEARAAGKKAGIIELQPGTTALDLSNGQERFQPKVGEGVGLNGGVASEIPNYGAVNASIEGQKARAVAEAQAGLRTKTVQRATGPVEMTEAQIAREANGGGTAPSGFDPSKLDPEALAYLQKHDPATWKATMDHLAQSQGGQGGGIPLQDEGAAKSNAAIGEGLGKKYNEIQDSGFSANQKINKTAQLGAMLEKLDTGKLAPVGFEISAYAKSLGLPVGDKLDNAQAAKAVANSIALELRNPSGGAGMPGAMSDADRNYLTNMVAGLDKTPGANKILIDSMSKLAKRDADIAQLARDYKKHNGKFDEGFYDELRTFSESHPLFSAPNAPVANGWSNLRVK